MFQGRFCFFVSLACTIFTSSVVFPISLRGRRGRMIEASRSQQIHKVIIIGSGPAGLSAAICCGRAKLKPLVIEGSWPGGQLATTMAVENWPGHITAVGPDLTDIMREQAEERGACFLCEEVESVSCAEKPFRIRTCDGEELLTEALIVTTGAANQRLGCPGEDEYWGRGVGICAACDAPFMEGKDVVIVGGGYPAVLKAEYLARFADSVTIVQIRDELTAVGPAVDAVKAHPKILIVYNSSVVEVQGDGEHANAVVVENHLDASRTVVPAYGLFVSIGVRPQSELFEGQLELDEQGHIVLMDDTQQTSVEGVFAAGDVCNKYHKKAIVAAGDGCCAGLEAEYYLTSIGSISSQRYELSCEGCSIHGRCDAA